MLFKIMIVSYAQCCVNIELIATPGSLAEIWVKSDGGMQMSAHLVSGTELSVVIGCDYFTF